ncbi:hypothetical protein GALMADRAFT_155469 [Galerina marginata CBS 339.88]|uniref:CHAT domain-containing protein n=1 Tax=Galerina marginata (strain CBS 339.88) TaxID=685588 RepID=A0A067TF66_GALM3|nr:hypothetical protein GALMADRAFT_155469 [Galerina marginata CBS 339.88]
MDHLQNPEELLSVRRGEIHLKDIVIICRPQDSHFAINIPQIIISGLNDFQADKTLSLERVSSNMWKYDGLIEVPAISKKLVIIARSEELGDVGRIRFSGADFRDIVARFPPYNRIDRQLMAATKDKGPILTASFKVVLSFPASGDNMLLESRCPSPLKVPVPTMEESRTPACTAWTCPDGHLHMPPLLNGLGNLFYRSFNGTQNLAHTRQMISSQKEMIRLAELGEADLRSLLNKLGFFFRECFESTGNLADISDAISAYRRAVQITPDGVAGMCRQLDDFGNSLYHRFKYTGCFTDISESVSAHQRAVKLSADCHPDLPMRLTHLGIALCSCFERTGDLADISEAISAHQTAIQLAPDMGTMKLSLLVNLGHAFCCRYECTQDLADMSQAISAYQSAVELCGDSVAISLPFVTVLPSLFHPRFRVAHTSDLAKAVSAYQHSDIPQQLYNLGILFHHHFERSHNLIYVSVAISALQRAVQLTPDGHDEMPRRLHSLGRSFCSRSEYTRDLADISYAIPTLQTALDLAPDTHDDIPSILANLVKSFCSRFRQTGDLGDISDAISAHQGLVRITPNGHANMALRLNKLGDLFQLRFKSTRNPADVSEAISATQRLIQLTPDGDRDMVSRLTSLGDLFQLRFECTGDLADVEMGILNYRLGATSVFGLAKNRLKAAQHWLKLSQIHNPSKSLDVYHVSIKLISQIAGLEQPINERYSSLQATSGMSTTAAAAALTVGRPDTALEWLEQSRCIVWGQLNHLRTPLDRLRSVDPQLANDVLAASRAVMGASHRMDRQSDFLTFSIMDVSNAHSGFPTHMRDDRNSKDEKLAQDWEKVLSTVRAIPEFEDFLQPLPCFRLVKHLPESGFVVVINIADDRCDALALTHGIDTPHHIPLENFSYNQAVILRGLLKDHLVAQGVRSRGSEPDLRGMRLEGGGGAVIRETLRQLWLGVVKPVLDGLGLSQPPSEPVRIWWCPTGPLAFLPLHAAGIYDQNTPGATISDYAISSYTPTINALLDRVKNMEKAVRITSRPLMISQPNTPRFTPIPNTTREISAVQKELAENRIQALLLNGKDATIARVSSAMGTYSDIHLACHAIQDVEEPLNSGFELNDGRLTLSKIIQQQIPMAGLAFLSACQTSSGDEKLSEEAVHLGAGMLAAGYQGVIATMWSIQDRYGPEIAKDFYAQLLSLGGTWRKFDGADAAPALHYAIQRFRQKYGDSEASLIAWVPYLHMGL